MKKLYELRWCNIPNNLQAPFDWKLWRRYSTLEDMNIAVKKLIHLPKHRNKVFSSEMVGNDEEHLGFHFNLHLNPPPKK